MFSDLWLFFDKVYILELESYCFCTFGELIFTREKVSTNILQLSEQLFGEFLIIESILDWNEFSQFRILAGA